MTADIRFVFLAIPFFGYTFPAPVEFADEGGFDEHSMGPSMPTEDSPPAVIDPSTSGVAKLRAPPPEFVSKPSPHRRCWHLRQLAEVHSHLSTCCQVAAYAACCAYTEETAA